MTPLRHATLLTLHLLLLAVSLTVMVAGSIQLARLVDRELADPTPANNPDRIDP